MAKRDDSLTYDTITSRNSHQMVQYPTFSGLASSFSERPSRCHQQLAWYLLGILLMKHGAFNQLFGTYIYNL